MFNFVVLVCDKCIIMCFIMDVVNLIFFEIFVLFWDIFFYIDLFNSKNLSSDSIVCNKFRKVNVIGDRN